MTIYGRCTRCIAAFVIGDATAGLCIRSHTQPEVHANATWCKTDESELSGRIRSVDGAVFVVKSGMCQFADWLLGVARRRSVLFFTYLTTQVAGCVHSEIIEAELTYLRVMAEGRQAALACIFSDWLCVLVRS